MCAQPFHVIHYKKRLLLTVALIPAIGLHAQTVYPDIVVKYPIKGDLVKYFPYSTVWVIDNRMDTTKIYTEQTGVYPPHHANFNEPAAAAIKRYIDSSIRDSKKGTGELLINIEQLSVANIHHSMVRYTIGKGSTRLISFRRRGDHVRSINPRNFVYIQVTAWYKNEQGNYNKLLTLSRRAGISNLDFDKDLMERLIGSCIRAIALKPPGAVLDYQKLSRKQKALVRYTVHFPDTYEENISFEQINVNVRNKWKDYPVVKENTAAPGICYVFDDFKNNKITVANIQLRLNAKDSLYYIRSESDALVHKKPHWGVYDGTSWYINFSDSAYLKLNRQGDTYGFYIPRNLPDMHAMLSIQENERHTHTSSPSYAGANGAGLLAGLVAFIIIDGINDAADKRLNKKMENRMTAEGLKHNYRYCTLNMDNGDILYNDNQQLHKQGKQVNGRNKQGNEQHQQAGE